MRLIAIEVDPTPEVIVQITWRQWEDGRWEAWLVDEAGLPPHRVQDRRELAQFLEQACRIARVAGYGRASDDE
jgi:hypothetical protein